MGCGLGGSVSHLSSAVTATDNRSALTRSEVVYLIFFANVGLILGFWWTSSGFEIARNSSDAFNGLGRITGLLGTYLVLCQILLLARTAWLEASLGFEKMAILHKWNGYVAISMLLAHAAFQTIGYALGDGKNVLAQFGNFIANYEGLLGATVGLALLLVVVGTSIVIARRRMAYESWYYVHLYVYLAVALAFIHQLATGVDFAGNPVFVYYWCLLYVYVFGNLLVHRLGKPLLEFNRHRFRVHQVRREARGVFSVYISGRELDQFRAHAGQFAIWRFIDRTRWWQAHPFSISALPDGRHLRITVKSIGDFTGGVHSLKPGTPVLIEGPFGKFTERPAIRKVLLIAGGIGITPIRPLAEEMAIDGFDVRVLYRAHSEADVVFKDELATLAARHRVRIDYLLSEEGGRKRSRDACLRPDALVELVPEIKQRAVYVCGPVRMKELVLASLTKLGMPSSQIRTEAFRLS